jgi:N-acetylglutamate synthase-like GNAT family acetyltransferase
VTGGNSRIELATPGDGPTIVRLLAEAELPAPDPESSPLTLWVAREGDATVGCVGLEIHGPSGLLRSLVVSPVAREHGLGTRLTRHAIAEARARGVTDLVLLTLSAAGFFRRAGFTPVSRSSIAAPLADSWEFRHHGCDSAVCMRLQF